MARAVVSDFVIWAKHIHGDSKLAARLAALRAGEMVELQVEGVTGAWRKMEDGRDGRPTPGIRPIGRMQAFWRELYASRKGDVVSLELAPERPTSPAGSLIFPALARNEFERQAALDSLLSLANRGYSSDGRPFDRDEAHDRELDRENL